MQAFEEGYLSAIIVPEGESAVVGSAVAVLVADAADVGKHSAPGAAAAEAPAAAAPAAAAPAVEGPPTTPVLMPALSSTMKEGKIVQWTKSVGDKVESGDVMMVVESDKADMDVEAFEEGFIAKILTQEGEAAPVGAPVALLVENAADIDKVVVSAAAPVAAAVGAPAAAPAAAAPAAAPAAPKPAGGAPKGDKVVASPLAKALALEKGIEISQVAGTGPGGRITSSDVENFKGGAAKGDAPKKSAGPVRPANVPAGTIMATPEAKKLAKKNNLKLESLKGTGTFGRITEADVLAAAGKAPAGKAQKRAGGGSTREIPVLPDGPVPLTGMQVAVANNMDATLTIPSFQVSRKVETTKFDELYAALKPKGVTVSALLSKAVALAVEQHPIMNAHYDPATKSMVFHKDINIANAVAIEGGLITPVLQNTNEADIVTLSNEWRELVGKAKAGTLAPAEYNSGTFMVSNLGMMGVSSFGSLLTPGLGSILAVAASLPTVVMRNGAPTEVKQMELTITCDHRHIYGADAAMFMKTLAGIIEDTPLDIVL